MYTKTKTKNKHSSLSSLSRGDNQASIAAIYDRKFTIHRFEETKNNLPASAVVERRGDSFNPMIEPRDVTESVM
jgi:hypothetical protein